MTERWPLREALWRAVWVDAKGREGQRPLELTRYGPRSSKELKGIRTDLSFGILHTNESSSLRGAEPLNDGEMAVGSCEMKRGEEGVLGEGSVGEGEG